MVSSFIYEEIPFAVLNPVEVNGIFQDISSQHKVPGRTFKLQVRSLKFSGSLRNMKPKSRPLSKIALPFNCKSLYRLVKGYEAKKYTFEQHFPAFQSV